MITPRFKLMQTERLVTFNIRAPYSNLKTLEVLIEDNVFLFISSPYYLRLNLPGNLIENDFSESSFNAETGEFTFTFEKETPAENFPNLDLITTLLCPKVEALESNGRKIEIINEEGEKVSDVQENLNQDFGFALQGKVNFHHISAEFQDVFEVDPRETNLQDRRKLRLKEEQEKFNVDHYLSDYIENEEILDIMTMKTPWSSEVENQIAFTDKELDFLKDLSNVQYNLNEFQIEYCHYSLVDILYAYCYDKRTSHFEGSSESGWNVIKLSASLSWLDAFDNPKEVIISAFRRSLIYPLYRNLELSRVIFNDLKCLLDLGEKYIIKCLIELYRIFLQGDCCRYIINNLFIKDYIIYIMKWDQAKWLDTKSKLHDITITKSDLGLNLIEIENDISTSLGNVLTKLRIEDEDSDDSSSDSSDSNS